MTTDVWGFLADPSAYDAKSRTAVVIADRAALAVALRRARLHARLSQRALAAKAGVSPATVARIETERADPTVSTMLKLLTAAGVLLKVDGLSPPTFLFGVVDELRDRANRHAAVHRLDDAGFGYWCRSTQPVMMRAALAHQDRVDMLRLVAAARRERARR